jgi:hypothetical protein
MKKPPLDLKAGQVWEGSLPATVRNTRRRIAVADKTGVLWYRPGQPIATYYSKREAFEKWAERLLP